GDRIVARACKDEIVHAPVVVTHEQRIGAMLTAPIARGGGGARRVAYNPDFILDGRHHGEQDFLALDIALLDDALSQVQAAQAAGRVGLTGVCLHASTMQARRSRDAYLEWLAGVAPEVKRSLIIGICEIERGAPLISIADWCSRLRAHVSRVSLEFHYG